MYGSSQLHIVICSVFIFVFVFDIYILFKSLVSFNSSNVDIKSPLTSCSLLDKFERPKVLILTDRKFFVYLFSAFYDPRENDIEQSKKLIRILALFRDVDVNSIQKKIGCVYYAPNKSTMVYDIEEMYYLRTEIKEQSVKWSSYMISCKIPSTVDELPCYVSVIYDQKRFDTSYISDWLPIRISIKSSLSRSVVFRQLDKFALKTRRKTSIPPHEIAVNMDQYWNEIYSKKHEKSREKKENPIITYQLSYGLCVPFTLERDPKLNVFNLFEFIEYNSYLGLEKIIFYVGDKFGKFFKNIYKYYSFHDILELEVVIWPPAEVEESLARRLSIQDCLFRNIGVVKYLAIHDFDELILTSQKGNTLNLLMMQNDIDSCVIAIKDKKIKYKSYANYGKYVFIVRPEYIFDLDVENSIRPIRQHIRIRRVPKKHLFFESVSNCFKDFHCNSSLQTSIQDDDDDTIKVYTDNAYAAFKNWLEMQIKLKVEHHLV